VELRQSQHPPTYCKGPSARQEHIPCKVFHLFAFTEFSRIFHKKNRGQANRKPLVQPAIPLDTE